MLRLSALCENLRKHGMDVQLEGDDRAVSAVNTLEDACEGEISFLANDKYLEAVSKTRASAVLVKPGVELPATAVALRTPDPYAAMAATLITIHGYRKHPKWGVHESACINESSTIGENPNIGPSVSIAKGAVVGDRCTIYPGCYIAENVTLGHDCVLYPNVVVYEDCRVGDRCTIHAGSVIGEDGLGYAPYGDKWVKIPQVGGVNIGDEVEIGANCSIDRATLGNTEIGAGTKFSNNVTIGHGCKIGEHCMFVGQVGLAGSTSVGNRVTMGGQAGTAGHLTIGDGATVGGQAGVANDIEGGKVYLGSPAHPIEQTRRSMAALHRLPQWIRRIKSLESELTELKKQVDGTR